MYTLRLFVLFGLTLMLAARVSAQAQEPVPTRVIVRAVAHDAKLIGDVAGGARIVIQEVETGRVLAEGVQRGSTGDTERTVLRSHARGDTVYATDGAAGFTATLPLEHPTLVDITAFGPLEPAEATTRASLRMWLVPGEDVMGDGVVLFLHGFIVQLEPGPAPSGAELPVRAKVTMLCTCPTTPGGLWDADRMDVRAALRQEGRVVGEVPLQYAGEESTFEGVLPLPDEPGSFTLEVTASDPSRANFGRASYDFTTLSARSD